MRKPPRFPSYEPQSGNNRFAWIIETAAQLRAEQAIERARDREIQSAAHRRWLALLKRESSD